jgi:hypothetical protein
MSDDKLILTVAQQLYEHISNDLKNLSLSIQALNHAVPELSQKLYEIKSKVQNCEDIGLNNTTKLEAIEASCTPSAPPRRSPRITQKIIKAAKALYVTEYIENPEMHDTYLKKLQTADIDVDDIPDHLKRHAEKTFDTMTQEDRDNYIAKAQSMIS